MNHLERAWWFIVGLALVVGGMSCLRPVPIQPMSQGGAFATGGTSCAGTTGSAAAGEAAIGGSSTGGAATSITWPVCDGARKAGPVKRYPLQPKRHVVRKRPKASYEIVSTVVSRLWGPLIAHSLNQEGGSCTGNAPVSVRLAQPYRLSTLPAPWVHVTDAVEFEQLALVIYSGATAIDPFPGSWPPTDTGSDGDSAMRVALQQGLFSGYRSIESFTDLQVALQDRGCIFGSDWYTGMFDPDRGGQIHPTGIVEGAHEYGFAGIDVDRKLLWFINSWGDEFGCRIGSHGGYFNMTFGDFVTLFATGDVHCPDPPGDNASPDRWAL